MTPIGCQVEDASSFIEDRRRLYGEERQRFALRAAASLA